MRFLPLVVSLVKDGSGDATRKTSRPRRMERLREQSLSQSCRCLRPLRQWSRRHILFNRTNFRVSDFPGCLTSDRERHQQ